MTLATTASQLIRDWLQSPHPSLAVFDQVYGGLEQAITKALVEAEWRGEQQGREKTLRETLHLLCPQCKAGAPVDPEWLPNLVMHSRDNFIIRCQAPHLRMLLESEVAP